MDRLKFLNKELDTNYNSLDDVNWDCISAYQKLSEDFIKKFKNYNLIISYFTTFASTAFCICLSFLFKTDTHDLISTKTICFSLPSESPSKTR